MLSAALGSGSGGGILSTGPRAPDGGGGGGGGGILSPGIVSSSDADVISSSDAAKVTLFGLPLLLLLLGDKIEGLGEGEGITGECLFGEDGAGEFVSDR
jgi:hypothetical protein